MKRLRLWFSTIVISCLSLTLGGKSAIAVIVNKIPADNINHEYYLVAQDSEATSEQQIINALNSLTPAQAQQVQSILQSSQPEIDQKTAQLQQALQSLEQSLTPNTPSSAINTAYEQIVAIVQERDQLYFQRLLKIRELLTVQQRTQFNQAIRGLSVADSSNSVDFEVLVSGDNSLSLSATQKQQIMSIIQTTQPAIDQSTQALEMALQSLDQSLEANTPATTIEQAHNQVLTSAIQRNQLYFSRLLQIRDVLSVSQRNQLNEMINGLASD